MNLEHLREEWLEAMEAALARAVQRVRDEDVNQGGIAVSIKVGRNDENELVGTFRLKADETHAEQWAPGVKQLRLPVDSVTLSSEGRSVTLGRKSVAVPT